MKKLALNSIKFYRKYLSPENFGIFLCRYEPSCSRYTHKAIEKYGVIKGTFMGMWRVLRCNPLSKGGKDPVK
jgi:hypothetical protein